MNHRDRQHTRRTAGVLGSLLALLLISSMLPADGRQTLRGGTTFTEPSLGRPYYPSHPTVRRADKLAEDYKLDAAEALYRAMLKRNPENAAAHNGLGKITYFRTTSSNQNIRNRTEALYDQAAQHYLTALRYQPTYVEAWRNLGTLYMEQQRWEEATEAFERAHRLNPEDADTLERLGTLYVSQNRYNEALPLLEKSIANKSDNSTTHYSLGIAYTERGEFDKAHKALTNALYQYPNSAPVHYRFGRLYEAQGNGAAAVAEYKKALAIKPELSDAALRLADLYEKRGDQALALEQLKNIADAARENRGERQLDWELVQRIGKLSMKNQQPDVATRYYRDWLNLHPDDSRVIKALADSQTRSARANLGKDELLSQGQAWRDAEQALRNNPNSFEARLVKAKLDSAMGTNPPYKPPKGQESGMVDVALQQPAYQPHHSFEKAELLLRRFQFNNADAAFRSALGSADSGKELVVFGELFLEKGLPHLAEEAFSKILARWPESATARMGNNKAQKLRSDAASAVIDAQLLARKHQYQEAATKAREALTLNYRHADAYYLLGQIYEKQGQYAAAADHYYAWLRLVPVHENRESIVRRIEKLKLKMAKQ